MEGEIELVAGIISGAMACFFAILCWPKAREASWMLVIAGLVLNYGVVTFRALESFGVVKIAVENPVLELILRAVFFNLQYVLYSLGFWLRFRQKVAV